MSTRKELAWRALELADGRLSGAALELLCKPTAAAEIEAYRNATKALVLAYREYSKAIQMEGEK